MKKDLDVEFSRTYGFLRTASNKVGNTVEGVLGVEGSLSDMKKDLDTEYERWMEKKKALLGERDKLNSKIERMNGVLLQQKDMKEEVKRINGNIETKKAENAKQVAENKENEEKRKLDRKGMEEDIDSLKCATKTIQQAKQDSLDAANKKTAVLKDQNRDLQTAVFKLNKDLNSLTVTADNQNIANKDATSTLLAKVEALQTQIHSLEKELVAQAQLEESVERARERLSTQSTETVSQREKLTKAQSQCFGTKQALSKEVEVLKSKLNAANNDMVKCQEIDGDNQHLQADLNECINRKRSR